MSALQPNPAETPSKGDRDRTYHIFCNRCHPSNAAAISLCGAYKGPTLDRPIWDRPPNVCVVCEDLKGYPCEGCNS